jgi:murein DD-endopeptidase MepM/ murein hydrolase activator NlpD
VGVDLCLYQDRQGNVRRLDENTCIPAMYDGVLVRMCDDFLGRSIMMEHHLSEGGAFYTMYGHTVPQPGLQVGQAVREGEIVARLAGVARSATSVLPHLHVSLGWAPCAIAPERLDWETIAETLTLLDPLQAMDDPFRVFKLASACRELVQALKAGSFSLPGLADS